MPITHPLPTTLPVPTDAPALVVNHLHFAYPDGTQALHDICLHLQAGEKVALVGPNGAGKSTLLLQLNGILRGQGEIYINGLPLKDKNLPTIRALVGLVFQNPDDQLFSPTVFEDVAFGPLHMGLPEDEISKRVKKALQAVHMNGYEKHL